MKKAVIFTALCAVILVLFVSCGSGNSLKRFNFTYPLDVHAYISFDGRDYEADITVDDESNIRISFSSPDNLKNTVLEMKNGECFLNVLGITLPITDGGYSSENGLLIIRHVFSLSHKNYTDASVIKDGGVKYCVENYTVKAGKISVFFASDKPIPDKISAVLNGHEIEIVIVNE